MAANLAFSSGDCGCLAGSASFAPVSFSTEVSGLDAAAFSSAATASASGTALSCTCASVVFMFSSIFLLFTLGKRLDFSALPANYLKRGLFARLASD